MAPLPRPSDTSPILDWARYYLSHNLAVIPVIHGTKRASIKWKRYETYLPTDEELVKWFAKETVDTIGIAVVCGEGSGNLVCHDIDYREYCDALRHNADEFLQKTWVDLSGSGKLHMYFRASERQRSTVLRDPTTGIHVLDYCAHGHIAVLPPSKHPGGGSYSILYNGPENIFPQDDPYTLAKTVYHGWIGGPPPQLTSEDPPPGADMRILPFPGALHATELEIRLRDELHDKPLGAILQTPEWFELYRPPNAPRLTPDDLRSEVHFWVIQDLIKVGWDADDIEDVYATFPIGDLCYNRLDRAHHGRSLIVTDVERAHEKEDAIPEALVALEGNVWRIVRVRKRDYGADPHYDVRVFCWSNNRTRDLTLDFETLQNQYKFLSQISRRFDIIAKLPATLSGKNYEIFLLHFQRIVEVEDVPDEISVYGHMRAMINTVLQREGAIDAYPNEKQQAIPQSNGAFRIGWKRDTSYFIRGSSLMHELNISMRPSPDPKKLWDCLSEVGAVRQRVSYGDGSTEDLWRIPRESFRELV